MKEFFEGIINGGQYNLDDLTERILKVYALGKLTSEELDDLLALAADKVNNEQQVNLYQLVNDLQRRVYALEYPTDQYVIWTSGYTTRRGEIVRYDITGDGVLDLCMYDGGRTETALGIGAIDGWYLVNPEGTKTGIITRNPDRTSWTITPMPEEANE